MGNEGRIGGVMAGFMVPEVWCDRCSLREQSEDEGTLRELRADLRLDGWVRRRTAEGLIDLCYRCADKGEVDLTEDFLKWLG